MGRKYKMFAQFGVIAISGIVHEYILSFTFGFFYPVLFVMFAGFGCKLSPCKIILTNKVGFNLIILIIFKLRYCLYRHRA